jgi:KH domain
MYHQDTVFDVELANDQREFISGKKNGKINKIMKTCGVKIRFLPFSEYNFVIEVSSTNFAKALDGLTLMQDELPAEISFSVPEVYHRRIIGVGGKNIQRIMKKYGVYVKFSGAEEFASLGGYYSNEDNVVARTPMKNQINLDNLKHAVMELINPRDKDFVTQSLYIPSRLHRTLLQEHDLELQDAEQKANSKVHWPDKELACDKVQVTGPQFQIHLITQFLNQLVPEEHVVTAPDTPELRELLNSADFKNLVMKIKTDHDFTVCVPEVEEAESTSRTEPASESSSTPKAGIKTPEEANIVILLKFTQNIIDALPHALNELTDFLKAHDIVPSIQDLNPSDLASCPSDSFDDSLLKFNSESLANIKSPGMLLSYLNK